jgi:hypothetical protein
MGLHGSPLLGPRMGSVTYRMLCLSPALVLAVPPKPAGVSGLEGVRKAAGVGVRTLLTSGRPEP